MFPYIPTAKNQEVERKAFYYSDLFSFSFAVSEQPQQQLVPPFFALHEHPSGQPMHFFPLFFALTIYAVAAHTITRSTAITIISEICIIIT